MGKFKFATQITVMDMYRFQLRHSYLCVSGFIAILISLACFVILFFTHDDNLYTSNTLIFLGGMLFTVIQPFMLLWKSYKIIALTPTFRAPLNYEVDEEGVHVSQNEETADLPWENVIKVIETKTQLVIYNSPKNGFILPKKQIGKEVDINELKNFIKENVPDFCIVK